MKIIRRLFYLLGLMFATISAFAVAGLIIVVLGIGKDIMSAQDLPSMNSVTTAVKTDFASTPIVNINSEFAGKIDSGSGVYIAPNKILTAAHVVRGEDGSLPLAVTINNETRRQSIALDVELYRADYKGGGSDDLAIITTNDVNHAYYNVAQVDSASNVRILGYPSIEKGVRQGYTSEGIVARATNDAWNLTAYSKQGSSGGAVLNENDQVIGILVSTATYYFQNTENKSLSYAVKFTDDQMRWINEQLAA